MSDKSTLWKEVKNFVGPSPTGVRFWWIAALVIATILLLLPAAPLAFLVIAKLGILIAGLCSFGMGILSIFNGLKEKEVANEKSSPKKETSFIDYLFKDLLGGWFQHPRNQAQFFCGALLVVILAALLICVCPGLNIHIPFLQPLLDSLQSTLASLQEPISLAFDGLLSPTTTWWIASTFFSFGLLTIYDLICCSAKITWPIEGEGEEECSKLEEDRGLVINGNYSIVSSNQYSGSYGIEPLLSGNDESDESFQDENGEWRKSGTFIIPACNVKETSLGDL
jgi:hypothetical protein